MWRRYALKKKQRGHSFCVATVFARDCNTWWRARNPHKKNVVTVAVKKWQSPQSTIYHLFLHDFSMAVPWTTFIFVASESPHVNWLHRILNFNLDIDFVLHLSTQLLLVTKDVIGISSSISLVRPTLAALNLLMNHHLIHLFVSSFAELHYLWSLFSTSVPILRLMFFSIAYIFITVSPTLAALN